MAALTPSHQASALRKLQATENGNRVPTKTPKEENMNSQNSNIAADPDIVADGDWLADAHALLALVEADGICGFRGTDLACVRLFFGYTSTATPSCAVPFLPAPAR